MLTGSKQMDMIRHQDVGVDRQAVSLSSLPQTTQETQAIAVAVENILTIVASQRDVRREFLCE